MYGPVGLRGMVVDMVNAHVLNLPWIHDQLGFPLVWEYELLSNVLFQEYHRIIDATPN